MTVSEYFQMPETVLPEELIFGAVRLAEAPTPRHQAILRDIGLALMLHLREFPNGQIWFSPVDVVLDRRDDLVIQPDLVYVTIPNLGIVRDRIWGAPDLVVEVLSPHPRIGDLGERLTWFARYGVLECWLVLQDERRIEVIAFEDRQIADRHSFREDEPIRSRVLPEFGSSFNGMVNG
jgi:Uma2 family endonuclease